MKHVILSSTLLFLILGCGVMNNPKEEGEQIHVPQNITIKLPNILISDNNKTHIEKRKATKRWYN